MGEKFSKKLSELGFTKQVICAKHCTKLKVGREEKSVAERFFEADLREGWGHTLPAARLKGRNPTLGKIVVPAHPLRTCEALRIWLNHPVVETFWKRLKHWLGHGKMQLQDRVGAWSELCLRVLAYLLAIRLFDNQVKTLNQLYHCLRRQMTFRDLISKHFHPFFLITYDITRS